MAKRLLDALRAIVISPEALAVGIVLVVWLSSPSALEAVGARIKANERLWQWLLIAPAGILAWAMVQARHVLFPVTSSEAKRPLHLWPDYWRLKLRVALCLLWIVVATASTIAVWTFVEDIPISVTGAISLAAVLVSVLAAGSLYWAGIAVRERISK